MRLQDTHGVALIESEKSVPFFAQMRAQNFEGLGIVLESEKIQEKIDHFERERVDLQAQVVTKTEFLRRARISYDAMQKRAMDRLQRYLGNDGFWHAGCFDTFQSFESVFRPPQECGHIPAWAEVEAAVKNMPERQSIDEPDRQKKLAKIDAKIAELKAEMPVVPAGMRAFVDHWREIQSQCNAPANAKAMSLDACSDAEKAAWRKLCLDEHVNDRGLTPNPCD